MLRPTRRCEATVPAQSLSLVSELLSVTPWGTDQGEELTLWLALWVEIAL